MRSLGNYVILHYTRVGNVAFFVPLSDPLHINTKLQYLAHSVINLCPKECENNFKTPAPCKTSTKWLNVYVFIHSVGCTRILFNEHTFAFS